MKVFYILIITLISAALASCPEQCRATRRQARRECRSSPGCIVQSCPGGFICTALDGCPNVCTSTRRANRACAGLSGCSVSSCTRPNGRPGSTCSDGTTPPPTTPSVTPTPSPSLPACSFCSSNQFVKRLPSGFCTCVNNACDACPEGTICRTIDFQQPPTEFGAVYCQRCDCGYCDADGDACCKQNGANCESNPAAITSQCMYGDFEDGAEFPGAGDFPSNENVCEDAGNSLTFNIPRPGGGAPLPAFLRQCTCRPSNMQPCVISPDSGQTFCNIPRCPAGVPFCDRR